MRRTAAFSLVLWFCCAGALAQTTVIRAGAILDPSSATLIRPGTIVVEGGRIAGVNPRSLPARAEVIELGGMTIVPGLIDAHTHLTMDLDAEAFSRSVREMPVDWALRGARNAKRTLEAGFTTVRDVGAGGFADVALAEAIDRGFVPGPHVIPAGHAISITGGHCDVTGFAPGVLEKGIEGGTADGTAAVLEAVRYQIKHGAKVIKVCATAGVLSFEKSVGAQQMSDEELRAAVEEAKRHGYAVAAHAHGTEGIRAAVEAGVSSIEHGSILTDEVIALMKEKGTWLVPTTYLADAIDLEVLPPPIRKKAEQVLPMAKESIERAIASGVPIAFGTDAGVFPHGRNARELGALVARGMTPAEAIRTATIHAAKLLGVGDRGRIEPGLLADLIAVEGNPLEEVTVLEDVRFVMKEGVVYKQP